MKPPGTPLQRLASVVEYLVDARVGIVRYVRELPQEAGAPDFFHFHAQACDTGAFSAHKNFAAAGGAAADRGSALAKAIGEAVERYCAALYEVEELPMSSCKAASFPCVPPEEFALYSREQYTQPGFPFVPFTDTTPVRWAPTVDAATGNTYYVPAAMVFIPYVYDQANGEQPIVQPISTGLACHSSPAEAALSAICEVIERDAFTITWQAMLSMPQLRPETLSAPNRNLVERFERTGSSITLLNITTDLGVPTLLAVLRSRVPEAPARVFAAASDIDPERAVCKSLEELALTRRLAQLLQAHGPPLVPTPHYGNIVMQDDHVCLYGDHANAPLSDFIFASTERIAFDAIENIATGDPKRDLQSLIEKVRTVCHKVLLADLTSPDVRNLGLTVVRAVIPGLHPLFIGHSLRAMGGSRLWEVPQKLGYQGITQASGDNPAPHPYP